MLNPNPIRWGLTGFFSFALLWGCSTADSKKSAEEKAAEASETQKASSGESGQTAEEEVVDFYPPRPTFQELRDALTPYGEWIVVPYYGEVWQPSLAVVGKGWKPYTKGRWLYTKAGWFWLSHFDSWGWAAFHFGRFAYTHTDGWVWVPNLVWYPAHVAWREGRDVVGWAPLAPGHSVTEEIRLGNTPRILPKSWVFVDKEEFVEPYPAKNRLPERRTDRLLFRTQPLKGWARLRDRKACHFAGPALHALPGPDSGKVPMYTFSGIIQKFGTRAFPEGFKQQKRSPTQIPVAEVVPDLGQGVRIAGPGSLRKLPSRKVRKFARPESEETTKSSKSSSKKKTTRTVNPRARRSRSR